MADSGDLLCGHGTSPMGLHSYDRALGQLGDLAHSLQRDQEHLFGELFMALVDEHQPDAVLIAGDVFDCAVPPAEAVELLDDILHHLVRQRRVPVVMIPGNHDEPRRLAFGARMFEAAGLHIGDSPVGRRWEFRDAHGPLSIVAASYFTPLLLAQRLADGGSVADHDAGMALLAPMLHAHCPAGERRVLVAHAFVVGGAECESERGLAVGGSGQIGAHRFDGCHYVALGHLHRPQSLAGGRLRYAGSPLAYSISEAGQEKSVTLVEIDAAGAVAIMELPLTPLHPPRVLSGRFADLAETVAAHAGARQLDALFVDEGFGTLDVETLDTAIGVLEQLRAGDRLIGVISHVGELRERLPARVEVTPGRGGSTVVVVE